MNDHQKAIPFLQESTTANHIILTVGQRLKEARRQSSANLTDLSARLKVSRDKLIAMEEGTLQMPHSIFLRGMLRSYAKALDVDIDAELAALDSIIQPHQTTAPPVITKAVFKPYALRRQSAFSQIRRFILWPLFILALSATPAYLIWVQIGNSAVPSSVAVTYIEHNYPPAPPISEPNDAITTAVPMPVSVPIPEPMAIDNRMLHRLTDPDDSMAKSSSMSLAPSTIEEVIDRVTQEETPLLSIKFSGESWYEITTGQGKILSSGVGRRGDIQEIRHAAPIKLVLGNTHGIAAIEFRGKQVALGVPQGGVARLILE